MDVSKVPKFRRITSVNKNVVSIETAFLDRRVSPVGPVSLDAFLLPSSEESCALKVPLISSLVCGMSMLRLLRMFSRVSLFVLFVGALWRARSIFRFGGVAVLWGFLENALSVLSWDSLCKMSLPNGCTVSSPYRRALLWWDYFDLVGGGFT